MHNTLQEPMTTRMSSKGQIVIPRKACDALGVHAGTEFIISIDKGGYRLVPKKKTMEEFFKLCDEMNTSYKKASKNTPLCPQDMDNMIGDHVLEMDERSKSKAAKSLRRRKK